LSSRGTLLGSVDFEASLESNGVAQLELTPSGGGGASNSVTIKALGEPVTGFLGGVGCSVLVFACSAGEVGESTNSSLCLSGPNVVGSGRCLYGGAVSYNVNVSTSTRDLGGEPSLCLLDTSDSPPGLSGHEKGVASDSRLSNASRGELDSHL